jgi:N-alpha-acetyl-L-2,4-diaminobutyrate deacetylase
MKMLEIDAVGMYDTAAEEMGKVFITTELGGGGTATALKVRRDCQARHDARRNVLRHAGIVFIVFRSFSNQEMHRPPGT